VCASFNVTSFCRGRALKREALKSVLKLNSFGTAEMTASISDKYNYTTFVIC